MTNTEPASVDAQNVTKSRRDLIMDAVNTAAINFMVYDRKEDEELRLGQIEGAIDAGEITLDDIMDEFRTQIAEIMEHEPQGEIVLKDGFN